MGTPATLPLSLVVNVAVSVSPQNPAQPTFNQGLIIGTSTIIPSYGTSQRIRQYATLAAVLADGFSVNSAEYLAASIYFSQFNSGGIVWIGRQDLTSIAVLVPHAANQGTGYKVGDVVTVTQGGASAGTAQVAAVGGPGNVTALTLLTDGTGYSVATGLATTTTGAGVGLQVDVSSIGETPLVALQYCRAANSNWYSCYSTTAIKADHEAIAAWIQTATPFASYFYTTSDADALNGVANNVFAFLKGANYNRVLGVYSTTQGGAFPNNVYAGAALMGVAMALNTGLINSAYTLKFKQLTGIAVEPLTQTQIGVINGNNGNVYVNYSNSYNIGQQGTVANGQFFDEIINLDMLSTNIQFAVWNVLVGNPKVPQTDVGQQQLLDAVIGEAELARQIGFIGSDLAWAGPQILGLLPGQVLPSGYIVQSPSYRTQTTANRQARQAMPIYLSLVEAGAVHSVTIQVNVQR